MSVDSLVRDLGGANPYELLGLTASASGTEIKEARRRLLRQAHPDLADGDGELARVVNIAADLLLDPQRRAMFDTAIEARVGRGHPGDPGPVKVQAPPPDEPIHPGRVTEPSPSGQRPARPRVIRIASRLMYAAAISCALFFIVGAAGTGTASDPGGRMANITEALVLSAAPIAVWIAVTTALATGISRGWRGICGAGWALTIIILLPIGLGCGTLMTYTLTPAAASTAGEEEVLQRVPDLIQSTMVWAFPLGLAFALTAMVLLLLPASRRYLETVAAVRDASRRVARHRARRRAR